MIHLVAHDNVGTGYALQESDGRWIVRFHHNYNKYFTFTKDAFSKGYLKDCGIVTSRTHMDKNFQIILQTAEQLATNYGKEGWTGDCNDFTQASSSVSQELTNMEVERLWDEIRQ